MEHIAFIYDKLKEIENYIKFNNVNYRLLCDFNLEKYRDSDSINDLLLHANKDPPNIYHIIDDTITPHSGHLETYYIDINNTSIKSIICLLEIINSERNDCLQIICHKLGKSNTDITLQRFADADILSIDKGIKLENISNIYNDSQNDKKFPIVRNQMIVIIDNWNNNWNTKEFFSLRLRIKIVVDDDIKYYLIDDENESDAKLIKFTEEALDKFIKNVL